MTQTKNGKGNSRYAEEYCSFCGKRQSEVLMLFQGAGEARICNECIEQGYRTLAEHHVVSDQTGSASAAGQTPLRYEDLLKPAQIKEFLDQYVIGQEEAKRYLSVAVYNHYKRLLSKSTDADVEIDKSNVVLVGPTGTGKTLMARTIARLLNVPFTIVDATVLTEAGYVGEDVESILSRLLQVASYDVAAAERGIVFIDEIDKIDYDNTETRKAVWSILDYAKHETGFDAATGRICIQVYPEKNGGCEIYITKLQKNELPSAGNMNYTNEKTAAVVPKVVCAVYQFEDSENLMRVCKFLARRGYSAKSGAFVEQLPHQKHRYFLLIFENAPTAQGKKAKYLRENLFIGEFGTRMESETLVPYLKEHCRCFCEGDAVHMLAVLAK